MQRYQDSIILSTGQAVQGASVQVLTYPAGAVATIYSDNSSTVATNPLITDANGHFAFYAADARYSLVITKVGIAPITVSDILLEDPADGSAAFSASGGAALVGFLPSGTTPIYGFASRTVQDELREHCINVKDFKCSNGSAIAGDGSHDDTSGIQSAITYCIANTVTTFGGIRARPLYFPRGTYKVTDSLNCTAGSNAYPAFVMFGEGMFQSVISANLAGAYPIIDMLGNGFGGMTDIGVFSTGGLETCAVLLAPTVAAGSSSGQQMVFNRFAANLGIVNVGADLVTLNDPYIASIKGNALTTGSYNPNSIASKYASISSVVFTYTRVNGGQLVSSDTTTEAIWFTDGNALIVHGTYIAVAGATGTRPCIIKVGYSGSNETALRMFGFRTENQSLQTGLAIVKTAFTNTSRSTKNGALFGDMATDVTGALFNTPATVGSIEDYDINVNAGGAAAQIFANNSLVLNTRITTSLLSLGTLDTASANVEIVGIQNTQVSAALSNNALIPGLVLKDNTGVTYRPITDAKINPAASATSLYDQGRFIVQSLNTGTQSYTGGSGLVTTYSFSVPAGVLLRPPGAPSTSRYAHGKIVLLGQVQSTAAINGQIKVIATDGTTPTTILATGTAIAAYVAGLTGIVLTIDLYDVATDGTAARGVATLEIGTQVFSNAAVLTSINLASALTINVQVQNTANSPYYFLQIDGWI